MASRIDVEYHAFRSGLKPAIRLTADPGQVGPMVARYTALGCAVVTADAIFSTDHYAFDRPIQVLYVARTQAEAEALRAAEGPLRGGSMDSIEKGTNAVRDIGLRLGYPPCCVEACCVRYQKRFELARQRVVRAAQAYAAARDAWVPKPRWQLDDLMFAARASVISFEPCTYVCDTATRFADALLAVIARVDARARADLEAALKRNVAVDMHGGRAIVTLESGVITRSEPLRGAEGQVLDKANEALAPTLVGRHVTAEGIVPDTGDLPVLVLAFAGE